MTGVIVSTTKDTAIMNTFKMFADIHAKCVSFKLILVLEITTWSSSVIFQLEMQN